MHENLVSVSHLTCRLCLLFVWRRFVCPALWWKKVENRLLSRWINVFTPPATKTWFWVFLLVFWFIVLCDDINHMTVAFSLGRLGGFRGFWTMLVILATLHCHRLLMLHSVKVLPGSAPEHVIDPRESIQPPLRSRAFCVHLRLSATRCSPVTSPN